MSLFWRIFLLNAVVLMVATMLLLGPVTVSSPVLPAEAAVVVAGLVAMLVANAVLLRVGLAPLRRVTRAMAAADLLRPGRRPSAAGHGEIAELITTFNTMLDRLESEQAAGSAHVLSGQEAERQRIAQELHDEVGQTLTAVLLQLKHVTELAPGRCARSCTRSARPPAPAWRRSAASRAGCGPGSWRNSACPAPCGR